MVHVLKVDPASNAPLTGLIAQRIKDYAQAHTPTSDPEVVTRQALAALWAGDPNLLVLALVDDGGGTAEVVGHLLANYGKIGQQGWVWITQVKALQNVGDAITQAAFHVEQWAQTKGALGTVLISHRDPDKSGPERWRRLGYVPTHTILTKTFQDNGHGG